MNKEVACHAPDELSLVLSSLFDKKSLLSLLQPRCSACMLSKQRVCGDDKYTGKNYDHRRGWVEEQLLKLTEAFAIDVAAYAFFTKERE
ncbi:Conserved hypothetical protein [Shewanella piezotolerans WP3]|uniref:Transposase n=1 Tax=Shewanella piezotolerans (strain WP3 / JCM 13877) TaxID=225849 RepID=B8CMQ1_SHEPW|nr:Conserved hypothetical protein [Shewanella piezotolerans WP3]